MGQGPPGNFAKILLNISGVRINPAFNADVSSPGWVTIAVPSQAGTGNGQNPGDVQIDLLHTQTAATFFNTGGVPPGTYQTVQILVNDTDPGTIVPACASAGTGNEGCTAYPMQFTNGSLRSPVIFTLGAPMIVTEDATAPLVINLAVSIDSPPAISGQPYMVSVTASEVDARSFLASVSGTITQRGVASGLHFTRQTVFAELSGTNTIIESVPLKTKRTYTLELPADPGGTTYDIFVSGGAGTYAALQGITVVPGLGLNNENMTTVATNASTLAGVVSDSCTGLGIPGAQLELLAPKTTATPSSSPMATPTGSSFCFEHPNQCVVVANASADQAGNYPLPGTTRNPSQFAEVPAGQRDLAVVVNASGYTSLSSSALTRAMTKIETCSASSSTTECDFSLTTGYINGVVNLVTDPPPGNSVLVQVFAENSGTNELVSALDQPLTFNSGVKSVQFTLNVPITQEPLDLFAVAIDPFLGGPDPFTGHDISVLADIPGPSGPCVSVPPGGAAPTPTPIAFAPMNCVGHGSIIGTVQNPDIGTSVEVEKLDPTNNLPVQILGTSPALFSSNPPTNNAYTLCVPPDSYLLQRFELPPSTPGASPSSTPTPAGAAQAIMVPAPASTSSPCPSTCSNSDLTTFPCPGICAATNANPL